MKDLEVFERFMSLMKVPLRDRKIIDGNTVLVYDDEGVNRYHDEDVTTVGYDYFYFGGIFDKDGKMLKSYMDSHVAYSSDNNRYIYELMNK